MKCKSCGEAFIAPAKITPRGTYRFEGSCPKCGIFNQGYVGGDERYRVKMDWPDMRAA